MAKSPTVTKAEEEVQTAGAVATVASAGLPADIADEFLADAGAGMESVGAQDLQIPFIGILQALSPQCKTREPTYIEGAKDGMFFNNVTQEMYDGDVGIFVIPVYYMRRYTQWKPRDDGGGLQHDYGQDDSILQQTTKNDKMQDVLTNGDVIRTSGDHFVFLVDKETGSYERAVISMSSTQLKKSKRWNTMMKKLQVSRPDGKGVFTPASFYKVYHLTTVGESNKKGSWSGYSIAADADTISLPNGIDIYRAAKEFCEAIKSGAVKVAPPQDDGLEQGDDSTGVKDIDPDAVPI